MRVLTLLAVLGASISCVVSSAFQETNAQRMARGLPPNPPLRLAREPTRAFAAKRAHMSPQPPVTCTGRLEVRNPVSDDGDTLGYVRNWKTSGTISGINAVGVDLYVSITIPSSGHAPFDILSTNPTFPAPFYVGAGGNSLQNNSVLDPGIRSSIDFTNVEQTTDGSTPVLSPRGVYVESAIWTINQSTKELKAQWINPDGSKPSTFLAYDIRSNALFFVSNITAWNENNDTPASLVNLFLAPV